MTKEPLMYESSVFYYNYITVCALSYRSLYYAVLRTPKRWVRLITVSFFDIKTKYKKSVCQLFRDS